MPKNFIVESLRHHLLRALERARLSAPQPERKLWEEVCATIDLHKRGNQVVASWIRPSRGEVSIDQRTFALYRRGDMPRRNDVDPLEANSDAADAVAREIGAVLGLPIPPRNDRYLREERFHNEWAADVSPEQVLVTESFEATTAPENRFILDLIGSLDGKRVLDLGCGLGEAAVYFAKAGATVTACDVSSGMLDLALRVARAHGVVVTAQCAPAEATGLPDACFDVVYAGNLLHHVDTAAVLDELYRILVPGGLFVTWDPLAHNPLIKIYRRLAMGVRTIDEHPLRMEDIRLFEIRFVEVGWRTFWFFTLAIFLRFYIIERVHPSKERYWKKILTDAPRLTPLYKRLEAWDRWLLARAPWLQRYCWNIVVWGRKPAKT